MLQSSIIQKLLSNQAIPHRLVDSSNLQNITEPHASVSLLKDDTGIVMAIYSNGEQFDLLTLKSIIERSELRFMSLEELQQTLTTLNQKEQAFTLGGNTTSSKNTIQLIIDEPVSTMESVLLVTDNPAERIQVDIWDMQVMIENALIGGIFSRTNQLQKNASSTIKSNLLDELRQIEQLPVMPALATNLLKLRANPDSTVDDMVKVIASDPALTAQVLRYANSALFGFSGQIKELDDAIFRVLGYETVLFMSFGAALGRAFQLPQSGRLSMTSFWREATFRAALCQQLASKMPVSIRPEKSVAYITGLLHNIGLLILGYLFKPEFEWLNKMLTNRPKQSLITTEKYLFGCTHSNLGRYLMQHWNIPGEITTVVSEHHTANYKGQYEVYVWLTRLAGQALKKYDLSDADSDIVSRQLCEKLGLTENDVEQALSDVMEDNTALNAMADMLCA